MSPVHTATPAAPQSDPHPTVFEPVLLAVSIGMAVLGAIIGLELLTRVGVTPNTSVLGAILAMALARVPLTGLRALRSVDRQNLLQTVISSATFGGANSVFLPLGVAWLIGGPALLLPMFVGATLGMIIGAATLYWLFDSTVYAASAPWPAGIATAQCLEAGDRGGGRARLLTAGAIVGGAGQVVGVPMDVVGICWIGNAAALTMFGIGLLVRAYTRSLFGIELDRIYLPHGMMVGAGMVALVQIAAALGGATARSGESAHGRPSSAVRGHLALALGLNAAAAALMAVLAGAHAAMPLARLAGFVAFAAVAALVSALIVGISAMHAGWFPAFATALIVLVLGMVARFPAVPLALLVGFTASGSPAFADMGFDLKTGWLIRGGGAEPEVERAGRWQQFRAGTVGFLVAVGFVWAVSGVYFAADRLPPADRVYAATIAAGADRHVLAQLLIWAVPGAIVQAIGGPARQLGILFATGLLIYNPAAGWTALFALAVRAAAETRFGARALTPMYVLAGGFLAGSALLSFGGGLRRTR